MFHVVLVFRDAGILKRFVQILTTDFSDLGVTLTVTIILQIGADFVIGSVSFSISGHFHLEKIPDSNLSQCLGMCTKNNNTLS